MATATDLYNMPAVEDSAALPDGMLVSGNTDPRKRPTVSFDTDEGEVLLPIVDDDGQKLSPQQALEKFRKTGQHLGIFESEQDAAAYAQQLQTQESPRVVTPPRGPQVSAQPPTTPPKPSPNPMIQGLRTDYPDLADVDDEILLDAVREADFTDLSEEEYYKVLRAAYGGEKPKKKGTPTKPLGQTLKELPGQIVTELKKDIVAPGVAAGKGAALPAMAEPLATLEAMPDYQALLERGFAPKIAKAVLQQRIGTMSEMAGQLGEEAAAGKEATIRGAAAYGSAALAGAAEVLPVVGRPMIGALMKQAQAGAFGLGGYFGIKAAGEGKTANEILHETMTNAGMGAVAGPVVAGFFGQIGKTIKAVANIPRYVEEGGRVAEARLKQALASQADVFAEKFHPDWLRTRFDDLPILKDPNADPNVIAATLIGRVLGTDVAENASERAVGQLADKITLQRRTVAIDPSIDPRLTRPAEMPQLMPGMESPAASLATPMQRQPISPREALDAVIQAGRMQEDVMREQLIPQVPQTGLPPEPGRVQLPGPAPSAPAPIKPMPGMEPPQSVAAPPEPIVPEARPAIPTAPAAEPQPVPAAVRGEGGLVPEKTVLPRDPAIGERFNPFKPPAGVTRAEWLAVMEHRVAKMKKKKPAKKKGGK